MSEYRCPRPGEEDLSQSSDERMDTASESFRSQDTPNSVLSSDFDDKSLDNHVLRLQNPEEPSQVLRLSEPEQNDNAKNNTIAKLKADLNDSFVTRMSNLNLNSSNIEDRPKNLGISPPKFSSSLVLTTSHPLMGSSTPDNYPDVVPKKVNKEDEKESLSSIEDERHESNYEFYSPQMNNSKNNLYFSENFVTAESQDSMESYLRPDVARVEKRRKIIPKFTEDNDLAIDSPVNHIRDETASVNYLDAKIIKFSNHSTPKSNAISIPEDFESEAHHGTATEWCKSPAHPRPAPRFDLPIELSTNVAGNIGIESPDLLSTSTQEDKSAYQALLDPYTGSVALRHRAPATPAATRRRIQLPPEEDSCSLDNVSVSMDSEEEQDPEERDKQLSDDDEKFSRVSRSPSTHTASGCSEPIPEYSAAEELGVERAWLAVGEDLTCDMNVIEPFKRVLSHGGYARGGAAVIVFSACYLPHSSRQDYKYVMDNLFLYVIWTMERLVTDEYVLVYLHGGAAAGRMPSLRWLHRCYKLVHRRLRKSLNHLYMVHPTFLLRSFVVLTKPFVSTKFFRKMSYVRSLEELMQQVTVDPNAIPEPVKRYDARP